ncbi:MAG: transglutaminase family protein [Pseudomonadota bacterium]|nr:transglutaminase family protein [Pseudomonadota bacterium]
MLIRIGFDIELAVATPMALIYLLHVHPSRRADLVRPEDFRINGDWLPEEYVDGFGNHCGRVNVPAGMGTVRLTNSAEIRDSGQLDEIDTDARQRDPTELPPETLQFLLPSRYCEVDSELLGFAWNQFGSTPPGVPRVQAICNFVHHHLVFNYKTARPTRTALDGYRERQGVCRDFTHLAITLCRCMNIPARYSTGYLGDIGVPPVPGPMDFSAWCEVFLGDRWYTFDARHNKRRIGRIVMARGRDAGDVPITMCFGASSLLKFEVVTEEVLPDRQVLAVGSSDRLEAAPL